jgi:hypothetical protein
VVFQPGGSVNVSTGLTAPFTLTAGQSYIPANANYVAAAAITGTVTAGGAGQAGVTVSLLTTSGSVVSTTTTASDGSFGFGQLEAGSYEVKYTAPTGQAFDPAGTENPTTGLSAAIKVAAGQTVSAPTASLVSAITLNGSGVTETASPGSYLVGGNASHSTLTLGNGNQYVTLTGTADTVVAGNGNDTITLSGTGNSVTIGSGTSTINAGAGNAVVHAAGGNVTINASGAGNLFDGGTGMSFLNADGSANNKFVLNAGGQGLTTITGFNPTAGDMLDLQRTLAGTTILPDLSNIANFVTAITSAGSTTLYVDPTGGHGTPVAFAVLKGVQASIAQLSAAHQFSLS